MNEKIKKHLTIIFNKLIEDKPKKKIGYKNLKQLDRIEYFLLNKHRKDYSLLTFQMIYLFMKIFFLIIIFSLLLYISYGENISTSFLSKVVPIFIIFKYLICSFIIVDILQIYFSYKKKKELNKRFGLGVKEK